MVSTMASADESLLTICKDSARRSLEHQNVDLDSGQAVQQDVRSDLSALAARSIETGPNESIRKKRWGRLLPTTSLVETHFTDYQHNTERVAEPIDDGTLARKRRWSTRSVQQNLERNDEVRTETSTLLARQQVCEDVVSSPGGELTSNAHEPKVRKRKRRVMIKHRH